MPTSDPAANNARGWRPGWLRHKAIATPVTKNDDEDYGFIASCARRDWHGTRVHDDEMTARREAQAEHVAKLPQRRPA
jgi:hypothetical protein